MPPAVQSFAVSAVAAVVLLLVPMPARSQEPLRPSFTWSPAAAPALPSPDGLVAQRLAIVQPAGPFQQLKKRRGRTLLIVGGAMFLSGLLIGDGGGTMLAVVGVGLGAWGLVLYLE